MKRRSQSKPSNKQMQLATQKSPYKTRKNVEVIPAKPKYLLSQKRMKQSLMFSLTDMFNQSRNQPTLIHPWMKQFHQLEERIIGTNYIIVGPSQSGKYSVVKFALGEYYPDVQQILINCDFNTTQTQFVSKLLEQFRIKSPKCKWPDDRQFHKLITNDNIDFKKLNPYIQRGHLKFVIIIRNGQHLVGFKKQSILYSLFQWMGSDFIQARGGLVILTRQLMLIDRFQKRVKSRFCGNKLCIFRPQDPQIYLKIITKRIQAVINDKKIWQKQHQVQNMKDQNEQMQNQDEQTNTRTRAKVKKTTTKIKQQQQKQEQKLDLNKFLNKYSGYSFVNQLQQYFITLQTYLSINLCQDLGITNYVVGRVNEFEKSKNKNNMKLFHQETTLSISQQIDCLQKLKDAIQKNKELTHFFKTKIMQHQIITIPFVLRIFQHIFLNIEQGLICNLSQAHLKTLVAKLFEKNVEFQFPTNVMESNSLENFNNVELLLLILIYKMIDQNMNSSLEQNKRIYNSSSIKLTIIHNNYRDILHQQIHQSTDRTSSKVPMIIIERSIDRLYKGQIVRISPNNIWNSQIQLLMQKRKVRKGLQHLCKTRNLPQILKKQLQDIGIKQASGAQTEALYVNLTIRNN